MRVFDHAYADSPDSLFHLSIPSNEVFPIGEIPDIDQSLDKRNEWHDTLIVNGVKITHSDLWGIRRPDEELGYTALENSTSTNKWWQSNNIGARSTKRTMPEKAQLRKRILIFGDSFANSSRVPQNETIDFYLNESDINIEAVNFGVDGYSTAQSYLRYKKLKDKIEYDEVILILALGVDLKRDINVSRYLGFGWRGRYSYILQPRFIIGNNKLKLISSPYKNLDEMIEDNRAYISDKLEKHLWEYDAFYFSFYHKTIPILDTFMITKFIKYQLYKLKRRFIIQNTWRKDSESVQVTKKILEEMSREVSEDGGKFTAVILPNKPLLERYKSNAVFKKLWDDIVIEICSTGVNCIDFMINMKQLPEEAIDSGYDGTHYGPKTNSHIAKIINQKILQVHDKE